MKTHLTLLLLAFLAFAFTACDHSKPNTSNAEPKTSTPEPRKDFVYLNEGAIYFYDIQAQKATKCEQIEDWVYDFVCADNGLLYCTVEAINDLELKSLDLKDDHATPILLASWGVDPGTRTDTYTPSGAMFFNHDQTKIGLETDLRWFTGQFNNLAVYDIASKMMSKAELYREVYDDDGEFMYLEDLPDNSGFNRWGEAGSTTEQVPFVQEDDVYYVGDGQKVNLTNQIDFHESDNDFEKSDCDVSEKVDPTGKKALISFSAFMSVSEVGFYVVSSLDGKMQMKLPGAFYGDSEPKWLPDGSLLYYNYDAKEGLYILDPDNNLHFVSECQNYDVLH